MTCGACIGKLLPALVFALAIDSVRSSLEGDSTVRGSLEAESCEGSSENGGAAGLLQAGHAHKGGPRKSFGAIQIGAARRMLSSAMFDLGMQLLKHEETLDTFVGNTVITSFDFPWTEGQSCQMRTVDGDAPPSFDTEDDPYGLTSFGDEAPKTRMLNMLDVGGNMGLITIGAFKKHPTQMRIVVVEPSPSTYFLLRWNLELNEIPVQSLTEFKASPDQPGVLAVNNGVGSLDGQTFGLCYTPPRTQESKLCECTADDAERMPQMGVEQCHRIVSLSLPSLFSFFDDQPVELVKMDCEGCEKSLLPSLANVPGQQIARFAGELHAVGNEFEDMVCKYEKGQWFIQVCFRDGKYDVVQLKERCMQGPTRPTCVNLDA